MKKLFLSLILLFSATLMYAQTPNEFNYQAVARGVSGSALPNQSISVEFTIHDATSGGTVLYQEKQTLSTNQFGLFSCQIGNGTVVTGTFASINWATNDKFLQVGFDPTGGNSFTNMATTQLISVPYAKVADVALNDPWAINGSDIYNTNTGNVGIGTSNPTYPLHITTTTYPGIQIDGSNGGWSGIYVNATNSAAYPFYGYEVAGNGVGYTFMDANGDWYLYNGLGTNLTVLASGNVGVGTTTPGSNLDVEGSFAISGSSGLITANNTGTGNAVYGAGSGTLLASGAALRGVNNNGGTAIEGETTGSGWALYAYNVNAAGQAGHFDGNVVVSNDGSGLGAPSISASNTNAAGIGIAVGTNSTDATAVFTNAAGSTSGSATIAKFFDGGASELVRIDNGGAFSHLGKISVFGDNSSTRSGGVLYASDTYGMDIGDIVGNSYTTMFEAYHPTPTTTAVSPWIDDATSSGDPTYKWTAVYATNGTIQTSDERLKENVQPISHGLNELMSLNPVSYQWKDENARLGNGSNLGFLAQDLEKVLPEVVVHTEITPEQIANAKKYKGIDIANTDTYGVKYSEIIPVLVKAIQEQQAEIETLKAQVNGQQK